MCSCKNKVKKVENETEQIDQFLKLNTKSFNVSEKKGVLNQIVDIINK